MRRAQQVELTSPDAFMITGFNEIVRLRFDNGSELRCTPGHTIFTTNRGYVEAKDLTTSTTRSSCSTCRRRRWPRTLACPCRAIRTTTGTKGDHGDLLRLPGRSGHPSSPTTSGGWSATAARPAR